MEHCAVCSRFGLRFAIFQDVLAPSSFSNFDWSSASLLTGMSNSGAAPDTNNPAAAGDSFQSIFAQAITPPAGTPSSLAQPTPTMAAEPPWTNAADEASSSATTASPLEHQDTSAPARSSDHATLKSALRTLPQRADAAKQEYVSHARQPAETSRTNGTAAAENPGNQTASSQADAAATGSALDSSPSKKSSPSTGSEQNGLPVAATAAFGGLKTMSGAAFAMHITPAGSQGNAVQSAGESGGAAPNATVSAGNTIADPLPSGIGIPPGNGAHAQPFLQEASNGASLPAAQLVPWASPTPAATLDGQAGSAEAAATTTEAGEIEADDSSGAPQPVHTVQVQLAGEGEGRVDLRLVEHAGGLSVSVRASDSALTRGLQENLPELSARLAAEKYQTQTFLPSANEASGSSSSSGSSGQPSGQGHEQSGGRSFSQGGSASGGDGGRPQDQAAAWWRQMGALGKLSSAAATSVQDSQPSPAANPQ
jgi:hypothetical protein